MKNLDLKQTEVQEQLRSALEGQDEKEIAGRSPIRKFR